MSCYTYVVSSLIHPLRISATSSLQIRKQTKKKKKERSCKTVVLFHAVSTLILKFKRERTLFQGKG